MTALLSALLTAPAPRTVFLSLALLFSASCGGRGRALSTDAGGRADGASDALDADGGSGSDGNTAPDGGVDGTADAATACTPDIESRIPPAPLRRLTAFEYTNTVRDLLGLAVETKALPPDDDSSIDAAAYHTVAHDLALTATKDATALQSVTGCDVVANGEATCAQKFIGVFVARAFRRPVASDDAADFADVFAKGQAQGGDYGSGIRAVIEVALQSPEFLYRVEFGEAADPARPRLGRPTPYETAVRLSYLVWGSAPDDILTGAAARNELDTQDQIATQARRMLDDARGHALAGHFYAHLLQIDDLSGRTGLGDLAGFAAEENSRFIDYVLWNGAGDWNTLLTAPYSFVNGPLAQVYGLSGITGDGFQMSPLPAGQRRGFLTQASVLGGLLLADGTSTNQRGAMVLEQLLCGDLSSAAATPHPGLAAAPRGAGETRRQWLERVTGAADCQTCHARTNPLEFAFEHYGPDGGWRNDDQGLAIDAHGTVTGIDTAGTFDGAMELIDRLARSHDVDRCHVRKWMESAYGRALVPADACSRQQVERGFAATGGNIQSLIIGLTQTEAFLYRPAP